ncbi:uncharacterized protein LOC119393670 [Rhipicephalus sanguineus]|uniref:uncharacterized protein LOC119393670 n=1 Tax=Rhipicephalus sanguineus TaxID=34632 RepID=UPI001895C68D|nr:uncharacterized protein LOC119393670 [Rhipicephalus sanguineus]
MDENSFLNDTDLSSLHTSEPRATSTVLPEQRIRRSRPACSDIATNLFRNTGGDDSSLGILGSGDCLDFSLLEISAAGEQALMEEASSRRSSNAYLKERFDVSDADVDAQAALGFEESFTDAAAEIIEHDEQQFNREHLLDAYEEQSSCESAQFGEISRPSWMSSGGDDRITISAYLRSRSAPMDHVLGFSEAPPPFEEAKGESASASDKLSIRDLVEQQLGMRKSTYRQQYDDESQETSLTSLHSESGIDYSLEDASSSRSKGLANRQTGATRLSHAASSKRVSQIDRQAQGDSYFKRPLGAAPRARTSRISTASTSSSASKSRSSGLGSTCSSTALRIPPRVSSSLKKDGSQLPVRSRAPHLGCSRGQNVSSLKSPSRLHGKVSPIVSKTTAFKSPGAFRKLSSISSPDLRTLKSGDGDKQPLAAKSICRSDENLRPERNHEAMKEGRLPARELFSGSGNSTKNPSSQFFGTASSIQTSRSPVLSNYKSWPAPSGLVLPMGFLQHSRAELGRLCAGAPQNVVLALVNPTGKSRHYQIRQLRSSVDGRTPKNTETVNVQFPGQHTVASGSFAEIQGSFLSLSPGFVEIVVGIVAEDKAGGGHEILHSLTLAARVEEPCVTLEPSQNINFEGLHFDAEQGGANSCSSQEVTVINESSCAVPVVVCIRGGEGVFTVRSKEVEGNEAAATSFSVVLPSKEERAATSFVVECSTHSADCLTVQAKMEVLLDGCLLSRRFLAGVGVCVSIKPPSLTLEHVSTCKPLEVCCGRGRATSVWLKNDGPCSLDLELSAGALFHVRPGRFRIQAADHMELLISAAESDGRIGTHGSDSRCESILEATVTPQGFKVALVNLVGSFEQHAASDAMTLASAASKRAASGNCKKFMTLESNRRFLLWAHVHNLASEAKSLKIRNPNAEPINMEVSVPKPYHKLFQVEMQAGDCNRASSTLCLDAGATVDIHVSNANCSSLMATGVSFIESRLVIKSYSASYTDVKNVALYALGGELKVELRDTHCLGQTRHLVDMGAPLAAGAVSTDSFTVVNKGDWDAFVYLAIPGSPLLETPKESSSKGGRGTISVTPSCFVLRRKKSKTVSLTYEFGAIDAQLCAGGQVGTLSVIRVLFGFEALRQAAKRVFSKSSGCKRHPSEMMLPFLASFENEGKIEEVSVSGSVVEQVFMRTVSQAVVAVIASGGAAAALIQSSTAASFAPLEDLTFLSRLSLSELAE